MPSPYVQYPGTDFHDLNLDWLLDEMKKLREEWQEWLNTHQYPVVETPVDVGEVEVEVTPE